MDLVEESLENGLMEMYQNGQFVTKEYFYPEYDEGAIEVRETIVNEEGIFQKINYSSKIYEGQIYNVLYRNSQFFSMTIEEGKIKQLIIKDGGIYRDATTKDMFRDGSNVNPCRLYNIIDMMSDMAEL